MNMSDIENSEQLDRLINDHGDTFYVSLEQDFLNSEIYMSYMEHELDGNDTDWQRSAFTYLCLRKLIQYSLDILETNLRDGFGVIE